MNLVNPGSGLRSFLIKMHFTKMPPPIRHGTVTFLFWPNWTSVYDLRPCKYTTSLTKSSWCSKDTSGRAREEKTFHTIRTRAAGTSRWRMERFEANEAIPVASSTAFRVKGVTQGVLTHKQLWTWGIPYLTRPMAANCSRREGY